MFIFIRVYFVDFQTLLQTRDPRRKYTRTRREKVVVRTSPHILSSRSLTRQFSARLALKKGKRKKKKKKSKMRIQICVSPVGICEYRPALFPPLRGPPPRGHSKIEAARLVKLRLWWIRIRPFKTPFREKERGTPEPSAFFEMQSLSVEQGWDPSRTNSYSLELMY